MNAADTPSRCAHSAAPGPALDPKRTLRAHHLFTMLVGTIIGVGWIIALGSWIGTAGPVGAMLAFFGGAAVMTLIGLCFAELMTMFPDSGGTIAYAYEAFGPLMAFAAGWLLLISYIATNAYFMITLPWLLDAFSPDIGGPALYSIFGVEVRAGHAAIGVAMAVLLAYINHRGAAMAARLQDLLVGFKMLMAAALVAGGIWGGTSVNLSPMFASADFSGAMAGIGIVLVTTPFWFAGFDVLPQALRERAPGLQLRHIGTIIILATCTAFIFYAAIILAATMLVPRGELLSFALTTYTAFKAGFGSGILAQLVLLAGLFGIATAWNAFIFSSARLLQVLSEGHLIPPLFAPRHVQFRTPTRAIALVTALGIGLGLLGRNAVDPLIAAASITLVLVFVIVCLGLIRLRATRPDHPRPYRVPGGLALPAGAVLLSVALVVLAGIEPFSNPARLPVEWILVLGWTVLGGGVWWFTRHVRGRVTEAARRDLLTQA
ncbi:MAG: hypothetical protein ABS87_10245 [Sphingomonas sp. SCN 67-18]|uniref:APC family permease n=1 Tax=uncultured Sphingomonas sp. TaxID=158754 RepID=UPI0008698802|nr:APC family permease [Sphingomonas sp. SCN 67-18]ODU20427.1 MAG: hypothetical protein ABS87_10245 [Sphingomonas sp. SCN 67-18]